MFYVLTIPDDYPDSMIADYLYKDLMLAGFFSQAKEILELPKKPVFRFEKSVKKNKLSLYDYIWSAAGPKLASPKFAHLLAEIADRDVQLIDAEVWLGDERLEGYKIINILSKVSCIDIAKSETYRMLSSDPTSPLVISRPVFKDGDLTNHFIARSEEDMHSIIVVSEAFMSACKAAGIKGIEFMPEGRYA